MQEGSEIMFRNREEAGKLLAERLRRLDLENSLVLAIPRGGVPVGKAISEELEVPLELAFVKKVGLPQNREYAIGSVSESGRVMNERIPVDPEYLEAETHRLRAMMKEKRDLYLGGRPRTSARGRHVILVDDGIATGFTMKALVQLLKQESPAFITVAVPVASPQAINELRPLVGHIICLAAPAGFMAVGQYYVDFEQVSDREVIALLGSGGREGSA